MKKIQYLVMDVDGTLTDGKIYMGNDGELMKAFHIKDGCAIAMLLPEKQITPVIITGRQSRILENRCRELGITKLFQGVKDKTGKLEEVLAGRQADCVAYIGDDINDLDCMQFVKANGGIVGCPADAASQVKTIADYVSVQPGGDGAVRTFVEWLMAQAEEE